jgi:tRNA(Ile)-lysidine synthase
LFAVRPLIEVEREALRRYLSDRGIEWREDASNADTTHLRNRLRHRLIPLIESEYNPRFRRALVRLGQVSAAFYLLVREIAGELYENVKLVSRPGEVCLSVEEFAKLPVPIQTLVVDRALQELRGVVPQLTFEHYMDLVALCHEGGDGKRIVLPRGLEAARDRYVLRFAESRSTEEPGSFAPVPLRVPGATPLRELGILIETEVLKGKVVGLADYIRNKDTSEEILDYDRVEGALVVRPRQEGDYFHPLGGPGRSKLRKFLIDVKVPRAMRARIPILADERKIVCVLGYRISEEVRVTEATRRVLRLRVRRAE